MLTRLSAMLPVNPRGMWIGTFHGLCNRMLRAHHREASLPQAFQILDSQDQQRRVVAPQLVGAQQQLGEVDDAGARAGLLVRRVELDAAGRGSDRCRP